MAMAQIGKFSEIIGTEENIDYASWQNLLVYSIGCVIVIYDIKKNKKTFINYHTNPIENLKLINDGRMLITIDQDNTSTCLLILWDIATMRILAQFRIETDFKIKMPIYITRLNKDKYIALIGNLLHILSLEHFENITCDCRTCLPIDNNDERDCYYDCKAFYNSEAFVVISHDHIFFYRINDYNNSVGHDVIDIIFDMRFPFNLMRNTLKISPNVNWVAVITEKGNCLFFDQNGNSKQTINPPEQDMFSCCEFYSDTIIYGSHSGKIYGYNLYEATLRFIIPSFIIHYKEQSMFNYYNKDSKEKQALPSKIGALIQSMYLGEGNDMILIKSSDNSIFLSQMSYLINASIEKNHNYPILLFSYAHFGAINSIEWGYDTYSKDQMFCCGNDQNLTCYKYDQGNWISSYFDIEKIFNGAQRNYLNTSTNKTVLNIAKPHPRFTNKLFAGDNKGSLYLFDTKEKAFQYSKELIVNQSIESLCFSNEGHFIAIGFDNGKNIICDIETECKIQLQLTEGYYTLFDIENRKRNNHMLSLTYFLPHNSYGNNVLVYNKGKQEIEMTSVNYDNKQHVYATIIKVIYLPGEVLDFVLHSSGSYIIALINIRQIVIISIESNTITAGIDLRNDTSYAYSIKMDPSGLYLGVVCDWKGEEYGRKDNVLLYEIGTGKYKGALRNLYPITTIGFSQGGDYLSIGGSSGCLSIWRLNNQIYDSIRNVLGETRRNSQFWYQYEINYPFKLYSKQTLSPKRNNDTNQSKPQSSPPQDNNPRKVSNVDALSNIKHDKHSSNSFVQSLHDLNSNQQQPARTKPYGEVITVENIFEANLENCKIDPKKSSPIKIKRNDSNLEEDFMNRTVRITNQDINRLNSIPLRRDNSLTNFEKSRELKDTNEYKRINALKEQLMNNEDKWCNQEKDYIITPPKQNDNLRKEYEENQLAIQNTKQMCLEGNKANYYPMSMLIKDPTYFNINQPVTKNIEQVKQENKELPLKTESVKQEDKSIKNQPSLSPKGSKPVLIKIEKPSKPVLPLISLIENNDNDSKKPQQLNCHQERISSINKAIDQMLQFSHRKEEEEKQSKIDVKMSTMTFGENPHIGNINIQKYPEPEDIDDIEEEESNKQLNDNPYKPNENIHEHKPAIQSNSNNSKLNSSFVSDSKESLVDDIEYFNQNIKHFEKNLKKTKTTEDNESN